MYRLLKLWWSIEWNEAIRTDGPGMEIIFRAAFASLTRDSPDGWALPAELLPVSSNLITYSSKTEIEFEIQSELSPSFFFPLLFLPRLYFEERTQTDRQTDRQTTGLELEMMKEGNLLLGVSEWVCWINRRKSWSWRAGWLAGFLELLLLSLSLILSGDYE